MASRLHVHSLRIRSGIRRVRSYRQTGLRNMVTLTRLLLGLAPDEVCLRYPDSRSHLYLRKRTTDLRVYEDIFLRGCYAMNVPFVPEFIVDAGANIGMATRYFADRFPACSLCAIEPEAENFRQLSKNVGDYGARVQTVAAGVWWRRGWLRAAPSHHSWSGAWDFTVSECEPSAPGAVPAVTMGELLSRSPVGRIDVLKMDIEGSEALVLSSDSAAWLLQTRLLVTELPPVQGSDVVATITAALAPFMVPSGRVGESHVFVNRRWPAGV